MRETDTSRHDAAANEEARTEALRDTDSLVDWLSGECFQAKTSALQPMLREKTAADFAGWTTPDLVALLFDQGQPMATTRAVRDCLADRYCERDSIKTFIADRAAHIALQMAEDERYPEAA